MMLRAILMVAAIAAPAMAQAPVTHATLDMRELRDLVERSDLSIVAIERGSLMVSNGKGFPVRLSLAGCDANGVCRVVRIYTRFVIGTSGAGAAAANEHSRNFTDATMIMVLQADEPAIDIGRDCSLERGRTDGEVLGEIATAMSDAELLRQALMAADPFLRVTLRAN